MKIFNTQRAITPRVEKPELRFMCSARRLMVFNVCVKFHENMSSGFKVKERTRKLLTDTHKHAQTQKRRKHYTPMAYFVCRGYKDINVIQQARFSLEKLKGALFRKKCRWSVGSCSLHIV